MEKEIKKEKRDIRKIVMEQIVILHERSKKTKNPIVLIGLSKAIARLQESLTKSV